MKNSDLWQRLDRALEVHQVAFRRLRVDAPHALQGTHSRTDSHRHRVRLERPSFEQPAAPRTPQREPARIARATREAVTTSGEPRSGELLAPLRWALNRLFDGLAPAQG